jgi:hypothetical protein
MRIEGSFTMSSETQSTSKEEGDLRAKALEQAYRESHPNGPYPKMEVKPQPKVAP